MSVVTTTTSTTAAPGGATTPATRRHSLARQLRDRHTAECVAELRDCTDADEEQRLRARLVQLNMPLATALAGRYRGRGEPEDDLEQVAYVGLCSAAERFDAAVSDSFASYCVPTVLGELRRHFRDRGWVVRPPRRVQELQQRVLRAQSELASTLGRDAKVDELAEHLDAPSEEVTEALAVRSCYVPTSLDRPLGPDHDAPSLHELLSDEHDPSTAAEARLVLTPAIRGLSTRDRRILRMRFFDDLTQREIAEDIGVTQMQVSRVLTRIFSELRERIGDPRSA